jgi:hypothetical protein
VIFAKSHFFDLVAGTRDHVVGFLHTALAIVHLAACSASQPVFKFFEITFIDLDLDVLSYR